MANDIKKLVNKTLHDPQHISLIQERTSPESIEHHFQYVHPKDKYSELMRLLKEEETQQVLIFCNARYKVDELYRNIKKEIKDIEYIHAGLSQEKRSAIYRDYRNDKIRCLIATDVAGRGLDFSNVSHVINWDLPGDNEQYTHRTGRSGRMGRKGKAVTFLTRRDIPHLQKLIRKLTITPLWIGKDILQETTPPKDGKPKKKKRNYRPSRRRKPQGKREDSGPNIQSREQKIKKDQDNG